MPDWKVAVKMEYITEDWLLSLGFERKPCNGPSCGRVYVYRGDEFLGYQTYDYSKPCHEIISIWPPGKHGDQYLKFRLELLEYISGATR
jgi:hypothetical protein